MKILITGGAGFVGSSLAKRLKLENPQAHIVCFDNLRRRGSEKNLDDFKNRQIEFIHGDIRIKEDLFDLQKNFDVMIEASAEPSVLAGKNGGLSYLLETNLHGTSNCLEFCRNHVGKVIFLSTSRVYAIKPLKELTLVEAATRFKVTDEDSTSVQNGEVTEDFSTKGFKSLYGATKLASELLVKEFSDNFNFPAVINRCGVIAGPGQWGKVDQGIFTLWVARHYFKQPLKYTGFGGNGFQVRDLLHPDDLYRLIKIQIETNDFGEDSVYNIGGGLKSSTSLRELTTICEKVTSNQIQMGSDLNTADVDIPYYVSHCAKAYKKFHWQPEKNTQHIVEDIFQWLSKNEKELKPLFT